MKYLIIVFCFFSFFGWTQEMPNNPQPGKCYVRCLEDGNLSKWKDINCSLIKWKKLDVENYSKTDFSESDTNILDKKIVALLKKGYSLQINSHYDSEANDSINMQYSLRKARQIQAYLNDKTLFEGQMKIIAKGNTNKKIKTCKRNCLKAYRKNSRFEFRVINVN